MCNVNILLEHLSGLAAQASVLTVLMPCVHTGRRGDAHNPRGFTEQAFAGREILSMLGLHHIEPTHARMMGESLVN